MKIYILGSGNMASCLAFGLRDKFKITIVGRNLEKLEIFKKMGFEVEIYNETYDISEKIIILAFKPYALEEVSKILKGKADICISVLARTKFQTLKNLNFTKHLAICMPNIAAKFKASSTPYFTDSKDQKIYEILSSFGEAIKLESEKELIMAGVISGCAPAFLAMIADGLSQSSVLNGINCDIADKLSASVFLSTAKILSSGILPDELKRKVCSPGGTTIEGVYELEKASIKSVVMNACNTSYKKSLN